ncbi:hypothetical protein, partial [Ligilactobacillus salivarius]|uniref:hypothetical protein n=1 Tax=Ligilactobacillus salivarius TaxID=1624 RepID=UPI001CDA580C
LSKSKEHQLKIKDLIMEIWGESQHLYGAPKITTKLGKWAYKFLNVLLESIYERTKNTCKVL